MIGKAGIFFGTAQTAPRLATPANWTGNGSLKFPLTRTGDFNSALEIEVLAGGTLYYAALFYGTVFGILRGPPGGPGGAVAIVNGLGPGTLAGTLNGANAGTYDLGEVVSFSEPSNDIEFVTLILWVT